MSAELTLRFRIRPGVVVEPVDPPQELAGYQWASDNLADTLLMVKATAHEQFPAMQLTFELANPELRSATPALVAKEESP